MASESHWPGDAQQGLNGAGLLHPITSLYEENPRILCPFQISHLIFEEVMKSHKSERTCSIVGVAENGNVFGSERDRDRVSRRIAFFRAGHRRES